MLKSLFIEEAKELGFGRHQDLVKELGYNERTLSRVKKDGEITSKPFLKAYEDYKKNKKEKINIVVGGEKFEAKKNESFTRGKPKEENEIVEIEIEVKNKKITLEDLKEEIVIEDTPHDIQGEEIEEVIIESEAQENTEKIKSTEKAQEKKEHIAEAQEKKEIGIDISNEEYHSSNKMGVSKLKVLIDNAKEFQEKYINKTIEQKKTDALIIGSIHHNLVSEPHKFDDEFKILNMPSRPVKNDYIEAVENLGGEIEYKENSKMEMVVADNVDQLKTKLDKLIEECDKTICTQAQYDIAKSTSEKALNSWFELESGGKTILKAQLRTLLQHEKCYVEKTFYGVIDGVEVQARPDILINLGEKFDIWFVIDLKTLEVATPNMFVKQGGAFFWHLQEAFYVEVLAQNDINVRNFYFNCAGKKEFSGASFFDWGENTKDDGRNILKAGLKKYNYCKENNEYLETRFDYRKLKFEAVATLEVPAYVQHQMGDLGI